jgi:hypothetical protein
MNYKKPEVAVLGAAAEVILQQNKPGTSGHDGIFARVPAYDLDE